MENLFEFAINVSAVIGVSNMGLLSSRFNRVHIIDSFFEPKTYNVVIHSISKREGAVGALKLMTSVADASVWLLVAVVFLVVVLFHIANHSLSLDVNTTYSETLWYRPFITVASFIGQGTSNLNQL